MILKGEAAQKFRAEMERVEREGLSPVQKAFLEECTRVYLENMRKMQKGGA